MLSLLLAVQCLVNMTNTTATDWISFIKLIGSNPCLPTNSLNYMLYFLPLLILFLGVAIRTDAIVSASVTSLAGILLGLFFMTMGLGDFSGFIAVFLVIGMITIYLLIQRGTYSM